MTIRSVDRDTLTFAARGASKSGDPDEALLRTFTVALSDVYSGPTTKLPEPPVALKPGAVGALYLSREGWAVTSADGFQIFDADKAIFKYPECAAMDEAICTTLTVVPTSILVHGHLEGESEIRHVELLGPDAAAAQNIEWTGAACIDLRLTEHGARHLHVKSRSTTVKFWPTRIKIQGSPSIDQTVLGEVDILNSELARCTQHVEFAKHGAPIALWLTQDGVNAFHVIPQHHAE
ncbi:MAG: hypothetical protein ABIY55_25050 [Kofleriaceae bacterium]